MITLWMAVVVMGLTLSVSAQTLEEVQASVGEIVNEASMLSKAIGEVGQESILILRKCRAARWGLSSLGEGLSEAIVGIAQEAETLDSLLDGILDEGQELVQLIEDPQALSTAVESLIDNELLDGSRGHLIQLKLLDLTDLAVALSDDLRSLQSKSYSLKEIVYNARMAAMAETPDLDAVRAGLTDCIKVLLAFGRERRTVVIPKRIGVVKTAKEIQELLAGTGPVDLPPGKPRKNQMSELIPRAQEITVMGKDIAALRVQMYSTDGRLLFTHEAAGNRLLLSSLDQAGKALPNGVYLYAVTALGPDGKVLKTQLKKLVVRR
jgi:hypothetical protein